MKLRHCFTGIEPGDFCLGTVYFYGLNSRRLIEQGVISKTTRTFQVGTSDRPRTVQHGDYIFNGFE